MEQVMNENMTQLMLFVTFLTPLVTAVTEVIKRSVGEKALPARYHTLVAIVVALGLASLAWVFTDLNATYRLWAGLFAGLASAKVYDITKNIANSTKKG
ncbi:holin [Bacillus phage 031MP004]|nr:holin [Bacillus phage 022DV001]QFG05434.1 holin [Bacillus phage 031MP003]QFG05524.1 holin [Bacillus phage 031MP002]QFG05611.1 holin [Bacillus phage 031MP004]QFG05785.1 holin [Bacillus phage 055SW001]